jgi:uncharacterized protein YukE
MVEWLGMTSTEEVNAAAGDFARLAANLDNLRFRVDSLVSRAVNNWQGADAIRFNSEWQYNYRGAMQRAATDVGTMGSNLTRQVAEQTQTSTTFTAPKITLTAIPTVPVAVPNVGGSGSMLPADDPEPPQSTSTKPTTYGPKYDPYRPESYRPWIGPATTSTDEENDAFWMFWNTFVADASILAELFPTVGGFGLFGTLGGLFSGGIEFGQGLADRCDGDPTHDNEANYKMSMGALGIVTTFIPFPGNVIAGGVLVFAEYAHSQGWDNLHVDIDGAILGIVEQLGGWDNLTPEQLGELADAGFYPPE